jgi:hypothetical protein
VGVKFMMLLYETADDFDARSSEQQETLIGAWRTYYRALVDAGIYVSGAPLALPSSGATIRAKDGQRYVQDGPYADTKEQLGGQIILELPSLEAALDWAARCPTASTGAIEVRAVADEVRERVERGNE